MAIDVNPLQIGGLAALAGNNIGNLGLPVADYLTPRVKAADNAIARLGLLQKSNENDLDRKSRLTELDMQIQGHQQIQQQQAAQESAQQQARQQFMAQQAQKDRSMQMMQMQQQGQIANRGMDLQSQFQNKSLDQQGQYQQGMLGNADRSLDIQQAGMDLAHKDRQEELKSRQMEMMLKARSDLKKDELNKRGAFASLIIAGSQGLDPNDQKGMAEFIQKKMKLGLDNGIISKEEYEQSLNSSPDEIINHTVQDLMMSSYAGEMQKNPKLLDAFNRMVSGSSDANLTPSMRAKQEEKLISNSHQLKQLDRLEGLVKDNPDVFSTIGSMYAEGNVTADRNKLLAPIIKGSAQLMGYDPQKLDDAKTDIESISASLWADMAKSMSPRLLTSANKEFKNTLMPSVATSGGDSQGNAIQKIQTLRRTLEGKVKLDQQFMKNGKIEDQSAYDNKLMELLTSSNSSANPRDNPQSFTHNGKSVNIDRIMQANPGMSKEDVIRYLQENK